MTREAARVSKVSALNSGGSERAWSISPMVSGGSLGRSAADAQRQAMSNPSKQVFRMGASGSRLPRITPLVAEKTAGQGRARGRWWACWARIDQLMRDGKTTVAAVIPPGRRPDESGRGRHECRRHIARAASQDQV